MEQLICQPSVEWEQLPFLRKKIYSFLSDKTPKRIKRLIFISSIVGLMERDSTRMAEGIGTKIRNLFVLTDRDRKIVNKLNSVLQLSKCHESCLMFPMIIKSVIWNDVSKDRYLTIDHQKIPLDNIDLLKKVDPDYNYITSFFITNMPIWLIYGSYNLIHHDISEMIQKVLT